MLQYTNHSQLHPQTATLQLFPSKLIISPRYSHLSLIPQHAVPATEAITSKSIIFLSSKLLSQVYLHLLHNYNGGRTPFLLKASIHAWGPTSQKLSSSTYSFLFNITNFFLAPNLISKYASLFLILKESLPSSHCTQQNFENYF